MAQRRRSLQVERVRSAQPFSLESPMRYSEPAVQSDDLSPFDQMLALGGVILGRQILALFALACRAVVALVDEPREPRSRPAR